MSRDVEIWVKATEHIDNWYVYVTNCYWGHSGQASTEHRKKLIIVGQVNTIEALNFPKAVKTVYSLVLKRWLYFKALGLIRGLAGYGHSLLSCPRQWLF